MSGSAFFLAKLQLLEHPLFSFLFKLQWHFHSNFQFSKWKELVAAVAPLTRHTETTQCWWVVDFHAFGTKHAWTRVYTTCAQKHTRLAISDYFECLECRSAIQGDRSRRHFLARTGSCFSTHRGGQWMGKRRRARRAFHVYFGRKIICTNAFWICLRIRIHPLLQGRLFLHV